VEQEHRQQGAADREKAGSAEPIQKSFLKSLAQG
jgi:hypothetical protein